MVSGGPPELEEVRAIQDEAVFARHLVSVQVAALQDELVAGDKVTFSLTAFGRTLSYTWWIWKRTYHLLQGWEQKKPSDYVYDFVLRP